jgi:8-oxo-dGTP diphosphatase
MAPGSVLEVAAGILRRDAHVLACQRLPEASFGLRWEFPGGKIERGESPAEALRRELREELGIGSEIGAEVARIGHTYHDHAPVLLHFFEVARFEPEPRNLAFAAIRWAAVAELASLDWLEADRDLVRRLAASPGPLPPLPGGAPR